MIISPNNAFTNTPAPTSQADREKLSVQRQASDQVQFSGKDPVIKIEKLFQKSGTTGWAGHSRDSMAVDLAAKLPDDHPRKIEFYNQGLESSDYRARRNALQRLIKIQDKSEKILRIIEGALSHEDTDTARIAFSFALKCEFPTLKATAIEQGLFYPDEDINKKATWALSKLSKEERKPIVEKRNEVLGIRTESMNDLLEL